MTFQKGQEVYFKNIPRLIYGTIVNIIDEGPDRDPSVIVRPGEIRCHASDLESSEQPESAADRVARVFSGPLGQIPEQWAANPDNTDLRSKMFELLRELGWTQPLPKK